MTKDLNALSATEKFTIGVSGLLNNDIFVVFIAFMLE